MSESTQKPPWKRENPRPGKKKLSPARKKRAKARAKRAGRTYPNLVDNMREARRVKARRKKTVKKR